MTKEQLLTQFRKDYKNAVESQGKEIVERLSGLGKELYETPEEDLDKFVERNFAELKSLPYSGEAFRSYRKPEGNGGFASMFGYGSDDKAVAGLFGNGNRSWKQYDDNTLIDIAKKNGFGSLQEFKDRLQYLQDEYDEKKREEQAVRMNEDIRKAREKVVQEELYPEITKHPLEWIRAGIAKAAFSNITEEARKDALEGKGEASAPMSLGFVDDIPVVGDVIGALNKTYKVAKEYPGDALADALITGTSMVPVGGKIATKAGLSSFGKTVGEGLYQGLNTAAGEVYGYLSHDKELDPYAIASSLALGGLGEVEFKQAADALKHLFKDSKAVKNGAKRLEDFTMDKRGMAEEYVKGLEDKAKKFNTTDNPGRADYKRTKDNYKEKPITEEDVKAAEEARALFDYAETGKRPQVENKDMLDLSSFDETKYATRDMTDKEISELMGKHQLINEFDGSKMRDKDSGIIMKAIKKGAKPTIDYAVKPGIKAVKFFKTNEEDRKRQKEASEKRLVAKWMSGDIPKNYNDNDWKAFNEWAVKNPEKIQEIKKASFNRMAGIR